MMSLHSGLKGGNPSSMTEVSLFLQRFITPMAWQRPDNRQPDELRPIKF